MSSTDAAATSSLFGSGPNIPSVDDAKKTQAFWLHAWHDPVANIKAFSSCVRLADLNGDGENRLLIADSDKKLKVYRGTSLVSEHALLDSPSALVTYYSETAKAATPCVAVAAGPYVYIYKHLRPYYKFSLPPVDIEPVESECWMNLRAGKIDTKTAVGQLNDARDNGIELSSRSLTLLNIKDGKEQDAYAEQNKHLPLVQLTVVTCMETLQKNQSDERAVGMLVIGTESKHILILDVSGQNVLKKIQLPSAPVYMSVNGQYDIEYRIVVACRNGNIYNIKKGQLQGAVIEMETQIVGLTVIDKTILVGCMDNVVHCFHFKGNKFYSIFVPESITNISVMNVKHSQGAKLLLVGLSNGDLRVYNKKTLVTTLKNHDVITALRFGPYGREDSTLVMAFKSGALTIKMLQRSAKLDAPGQPAGPPPEQDIPLNVPKKTKLYVEQTQRERDQCIEMHRVFQRELVKLRLSTARAYVKMLTDVQGPISMIGSHQIRLDARVQGLGPVFKIKLAVRNVGQLPIVDSPVGLHYNQNVFKMRKAVHKLPLLVPGVEYQHDIELECIDPAGAGGFVRVLICNPKSIIPVISAVVVIPTCEVWERQ